jgi:hypothetical protein
MILGTEGAADGVLEKVVVAVAVAVAVGVAAAVAAAALDERAVAAAVRVPATGGAEPQAATTREAATASIAATRDGLRVRLVVIAPSPSCRAGCTLRRR